MTEKQAAVGTDAVVAMVQANIDAYNAHDVGAYLATYTPTATFGQLGGRVLLDGREAMRGFYQQFFATRPGAHCAVKERTVMGRFVVELQEISGPGQPAMQAMVIAEIAPGDAEGRIGKVWYAPV
jgi:hypothetical protein